MNKDEPYNQAKLLFEHGFMFTAPDGLYVML